MLFRSAAYRGDNPIYAQAYDARVMRMLALSFGVFADTIEREDATTIPIRNSILRLIDQGILKNDTLITVLAGHFGSDHGASYIEISTAKRMVSKGC